MRHGEQCANVGDAVYNDVFEDAKAVRLDGAYIVIEVEEDGERVQKQRTKEHVYALVQRSRALEKRTGKRAEGQQGPKAAFFGEAAEAAVGAESSVYVSIQHYTTILLTYMHERSVRESWWPLPKPPGLRSFPHEPGACDAGAKAGRRRRWNSSKARWWRRSGSAAAAQRQRSGGEATAPQQRRDGETAMPLGQHPGETSATQRQRGGEAPATQR